MKATAILDVDDSKIDNIHIHALRHGAGMMRAHKAWKLKQCHFSIINYSRPIQTCKSRASSVK